MGYNKTYSVNCEVKEEDVVEFAIYHRKFCKTNLIDFLEHALQNLHGPKFGIKFAQ